MSDLLSKMKSVARRLTLWHERRAGRQASARRSRLAAESRRRIQVQEWKGGVYLSFDGVPLLELPSSGAAASDIAGRVLQCRENYKDWKEEQLWESGITRVSTRF